MDSDAPEAKFDEVIAARHAGDLDGRLRSLGDVTRVVVELSLSRATASTEVGQHLATHLANLLGRLQGIVAGVQFSIDDSPRPPALLPLITPLHHRGGSSLATAVDEIAGLTASPVSRGPLPQLPRMRVRVGSATPTISEADVWVSADDWTGYVGQTPGPECQPHVALPFGAHTAAALAANRVFQAVRGTASHTANAEAFYYSSWSLGPAVQFGDGPVADDLLGVVLPSFVLAGVGAVGSEFLLSLWATGMPLSKADLVDGDRLTLTNLNRYVLFGQSDVGKWKATGAATLLAREAPAFQPTPHNEWWAEFWDQCGEPARILVSAVDTNRTRHQLQDALPGVILGASTRGLRAQVDRYDLSQAASPCLKCHNAPEPLEPDATVHARLLEMDEEALRIEAAERNTDPEVLIQYVEDIRAGGTGCGVLTGSELNKLRQADGEGAFAVSFVSSLAGTLLASQLLREAAADPLLVPSRPTGIVQLWRPTALSNRLRSTAPQAGCWCQLPGVREAHRVEWEGTFRPH